MFLSDLKIGTRLYAGFGIIVAFLAILLSLAYQNFNKLGAANDLNVHTYQVMREVDNMLEGLLNIETGQRGFVLTGSEASLEPFKIGKDAFKQHFDKVKSLTSDNLVQQERLQQLEQHQLAWLSTGIEPVITMRRAVNNGTEQVENVIAFIKEGKGKQGMDAMRALLKQISSTESSLLEQRARDAEELRTLTGMTIVIGGLLTAAFAVILAIWLSNNITRPLGTAVALAKRIAGGDLTVTVDARSKDETGDLMRALKNMTESLIKIVSQVRSGTDTIATASGQIASGNLDLSSRTEEQASSLEETASSMEELTSTVKQNADNARQANHLAATASDIAVKGGEVVSQVVHTMEGINESAKKIVDIISVIDGIAFQTNILALNAAVEAARAGEQGRGFAVVASEVRNLAQRSASAAKEIKGLIGDSVEKVENGSKLVEQAGSTMNEIVDSVKRVTDIMAEITAASQEQSSGIEQVNQAISQMDEATQQNAALVEEAAAASRSLQDQADKLTQVVSIFKLDGLQSNLALATPATANRANNMMPPSNKQRVSPTLKRPPSAQKQIANAGADAKGDWEEF